MKRISLFATVALLALGTKAHAQAAAKQDTSKKAPAVQAAKPAAKPAVKGDAKAGAKPADKPKSDKPKRGSGKKGKKADSTAAKKP